MATEPENPLVFSYTPEFKRNLRHLSKKYRHIRKDIQPVIDDIAASGKPGDAEDDE